MSIKNVGKNKYKIIIELGHNINGERRRLTRTIVGSYESAVKAESMLTQKFYHIGKDIMLTDLTFEEYTKIYREKYCEANIAPITLKRYDQLFPAINAIIGRYHLKEINPLILDDMYLRLKIGTKGKELTYHSQYNYYKLINSMFNKAINWQLVNDNPNKRVNNKPKKTNNKKNLYDFKQIKELIKALDNESIKVKTLVMLALDSSCRRSELAALRWADIDLNRGVISINKSLKVINGVADEKYVKTMSSNREVQISETTIKLLCEYKEWQDEQKRKMKDKWHEEGRVFTDAYGGHIHPDTLTKSINRIVKENNLPHLTFHQLRSLSISLLINSGMDVKSVSQRAGHADVSTTLNIYTSSFKSTQMTCAKKMNEILYGSNETSES